MQIDRSVKYSPQINPVTAYGFLEVIQVPEGKYLLQQAANSVLGKELISMAQKRGTKTINLVRRHEVVDELKQLGYVLRLASWSNCTSTVLQLRFRCCSAWSVVVVPSNWGMCCKLTQLIKWYIDCGPRHRVQRVDHECQKCTGQLRCLKGHHCIV